MKHKSEFLEKFRQYFFDEGVPKTFSFLTLRSEASMIIKLFCSARAVKRQMTVLLSPHQNGVAERRWQTDGNMAMCVLKKTNIPNSFWVRAVDVAFYLSNRRLNYSLLPNKFFLNFLKVISLICQI